MEIGLCYNESEIVNECNKRSTDDDNTDDHSEVKEDVLDLTVHCEPTIVEEEDSDEENGYSESLVLEQDCVDPLEFLEVDQKSVEESIEDDNCEGINQNNIQMPVLSTSDASSPTDKNIQHSNQIEPFENPESRSPPPGFIFCDKCRRLKNVTHNPVDIPNADITSAKNNIRSALCSCAIDKFTCKICGKVIKLLYYDSHMRRHSSTRNYVCDACGKIFIHPSHLRNHVITHIKDKIHTCNICNKTFKMFKSLKKHYRFSRCLKKKYYRCNDCGESFPLKRSLLNHLRTHEKIPEESFTCEICCIVFDSSSSKKEHIMQVHVAAQRFVCGTCGEAFVTESAMKRHSTTHSRSYSCKLCDETFNTRRELIIHRVQHRDVKDLKCKLCNQEFKEIAAYKEHKLTRCCSVDRTVCELCNKTFKDKTALKKHIMVHIPLSERSVSCDLCKRSFCGIAALRKHIRLIHADSRPYTCEFCSKSFNQLCKLKYHIVIHASDKPVSCDICNKAFSNDKDIKIHMRTHTGERPFKCNLCGKSFRQRGHVKTHQLVHTKEKPFTCQVCNKSFGLTSSLKKHMKLHTSNISVTNSIVISIKETSDMGMP